MLKETRGKSGLGRGKREGGGDDRNANPLNRKEKEV